MLLLCSCIKGYYSCVTAMTHLDKVLTDVGVFGITVLLLHSC